MGRRREGWEQTLKITIKIIIAADACPKTAFNICLKLSHQYERYN
jgi:hypothetical protein